MSDYWTLSQWQICSYVRLSDSFPMANMLSLNYFFLKSNSQSNWNSQYQSKQICWHSFWYLTNSCFIAFYRHILLYLLCFSWCYTIQNTIPKDFSKEVSEGTIGKYFFPIQQFNDAKLSKLGSLLPKWVFNLLNVPICVLCIEFLKNITVQHIKIR
jgi:hypothetical protein